MFDSTATTLKNLDAYILDRNYMGAFGYPYDVWSRLREEDPVHYVDGHSDEPYWAITKYADYTYIEKKGYGQFLAGPRLVMDGANNPIETIITMDPPKHQEFRSLFSAQFSRRRMAEYASTIEHLVGDVVRTAIENSDGTMDFVDDLAVRFPILVLCDLLGVPQEDGDKLVQWSNQTTGASDPEFRRPGQSAQECYDEAVDQLDDYFGWLIYKRREDPTDDLISHLVHAEFEGRRIPLRHLLDNFLVLCDAGNETTRNTATGGLLALMDHPDQFDMLRNEPQLLGSAIEEIVRFTSPVTHFVRTAAENCELGGKQIAAGDRLVLLTGAANRDPEVFENPDDFRIDRCPNPHVGFNFGPHVCLGAFLARNELTCLFENFFAQIDRVELDGPVRRVRTTLVNGYKSLPIRFTRKPSVR